MRWTLRRRSRYNAGAALFATSFLALALAANAATIEVTTTEDRNSASEPNGLCSLRQAVIAANTNAPVDGCTAGNPMPVVDQIDVPAGTYFLTLVGGETSSAEVNDIDVREAARIVGAGAADTIVDADAYPLAKLNTSIFEVADALYLSGMTLQNAGNHAIYQYRPLVVEDCWFRWNWASSAGGGAIDASGDLTVRRSTFSDNTGGSAGGAIRVSGGPTGTTIENSTFSGNHADIGGALFLDWGRTVNLVNVTFSGDTASLGSAIFANGGNVNFTNVLMDGDCYDGYQHDAVFTSFGGNVESPGATCFFGPSDLTGVSTQSLALGALAPSSGSDAPVHLPSRESVAVDAGVDLLSPLVDQRGLPRPADGNGDGEAYFDAGAVELQPFTLAQPLPPAILQLCGPVSLAGLEIPPDARLKVFISTAAGAVDVLPDGLAATSITDVSWEGQLPCPWPIAQADLLGQGFASAMLVSPMGGYALSGDIGIPIIGDPSIGIPSLLSIDGSPLADSSWDVTVGVANVEHVVTPGASVTLEGSGFYRPLVNLFAAGGNCGPLVPTAWTVEELSVVVPASCPTGPGSFQIVNSFSLGVSNAVAFVLGDLLSIDSITVMGSQVDVTGTGFSALTVANLFATSMASGVVENFGGLDELGAARLPLTVSTETTLSFALPADATSGPAYLQLLNPPFIPYSSSGSGPSGEFTVP